MRPLRPLYQRRPDGAVLILFVLKVLREGRGSAESGRPLASLINEMPETAIS